MARAGLGSISQGMNIGWRHRAVCGTVPILLLASGCAAKRPGADPLELCRWLPPWQDAMAIALNKEAAAAVIRIKRSRYLDFLPPLVEQLDLDPDTIDGAMFCAGGEGDWLVEIHGTFTTPERHMQAAGFRASGSVGGFEAARGRCLELEGEATLIFAADRLLLGSETGIAAGLRMLSGGRPSMFDDPRVRALLALLPKVDLVCVSLLEQEDARPLAIGGRLRVAPEVTRDFVFQASSEEDAKAWVEQVENTRHLAGSDDRSIERVWRHGPIVHLQGQTTLDRFMPGH